MSDATEVVILAISRRLTTRALPQSTALTYSLRPDTTRMVADSLVQLLRDLEGAFGDLPIPRSEDLVEFFPSDLERAAIRQKFGGRHWRDIEPEEIATEPDVLSLVTPIGFRFLLPSVLRATLVAPESADVLCDHVLWSLAPPGDLELWNRDRERLIEGGRRLGLSEEMIAGLEPQGSTTLDDFRRVRLRVLTVDQLIWLQRYVGFLRSHRASEFAFDELKRVEAQLTHELASRGVRPH